MSIKFLTNYFIERMKTQRVHAIENTRCKRKGVACSLHKIWSASPIVHQITYMFNGPSVAGNNKCANIEGHCGCSHAEPRVIIDALTHSYGTELIMLSTHSPCWYCSNMILDSRIIKGLIYDRLLSYPENAQLQRLHDQRLEWLDKKIDVVTLEELEKGEVNATLGEWMSASSKSERATEII